MNLCEINLQTAQIAHRFMIMYILHFALGVLQCNLTTPVSIHFSYSVHTHTQLGKIWPKAFCDSCDCNLKTVSHCTMSHEPQIGNRQKTRAFMVLTYVYT
jgi:hypothetical protein